MKPQKKRIIFAPSLPPTFVIIFLGNYNIFSFTSSTEDTKTTTEQYKEEIYYGRIYVGPTTKFSGPNEI